MHTNIYTYIHTTTAYIFSSAHYILPKKHAAMHTSKQSLVHNQHLVIGATCEKMCCRKQDPAQNSQQWSGALFEYTQQ